MRSHWFRLSRARRPVHRSPFGYSGSNVRGHVVLSILERVVGRRLVGQVDERRRRAQPEPAREEDGEAGEEGEGEAGGAALDDERDPVAARPRIRGNGIGARERWVGRRGDERIVDEPVAGACAEDRIAGDEGASSALRCVASRKRTVPSLAPVKRPWRTTRWKWKWGRALHSPPSVNPLSIS